MPTLASLEIPASMKNEIITTANRSSAIQKIVQETELPLNGIQELVLGDSRVDFVAEGGEKRVSGTVGKMFLKPYKLISAMVETDERKLWSEERIRKAFIAKTPSNFARTLDSAAFGVDGYVSPGTGFGTLAGAEAINVTTYQELTGALSAAASQGGTPSAIVLSDAAYFELLGATNAMGGEVYRGISAGNILGLPVVRFASQEKVGFIGDFWEQARWGQAFADKIVVKDGGEIRDFDGNIYNLTANNYEALIIEASVGFNFTDLKYFRKLTFNAPAAA